MGTWGRARTGIIAATLVTSCTAAPAAPAPQKQAPPPQVDSFSVVATGDVLIHPQLTDQADADAGDVGDGKLDFRPLLSGVKRTVSGADLAICHLETPLAAKGGPYSGWPSFSAPPQIAAAIADTGYDTCSTASNHTLDQGANGIRRTLDALDAAGVKHTGSARTPQEADKPLIMDVGGVKVAQIAFAYGFNGGATSADEAWQANRLQPAKVHAAARRARAAGADVVIASIHWGLENHQAPTAEQKTTARDLTSGNDIDLVVGHHAHVVQPIEKINGKWVAYGLGNEVAYMTLGNTEEGIAARFRFVRTGGGWTVGRAEYVPIYTDLSGPVRLKDLSDPASAKRYPEPLRHIDDAVLSGGGAKDGLRRAGA